MIEPSNIPPDPIADLGRRTHSPLRWGAIALGAAVDVAGTRLCVTAFTIAVGIRAAMVQPPNPVDPAAAQVALQNTLSGQPIRTLLIVVGLLCSVAGGYLTSYMAKTKVLLNAAVMGTCSGLIGLLMASVSRAQLLTASHLALTATTIPAAMLGGLLCLWVQRRG